MFWRFAKRTAGTHSEETLVSFAACSDELLLRRQTREEHDHGRDHELLVVSSAFSRRFRFCWVFLETSQNELLSHPSRPFSLAHYVLITLVISEGFLKPVDVV